MTSITDGSLKMLNGRGMNPLSTEYNLPADPAEMDRLSLQHRMWKLLVRGLYPPDLDARVEDIMAEQDTPRILDLGSGSGIWCAEIAEKYPKAEVVGFDLVKNQNKIDKSPSNCQFIVGDIERDLAQFRGSFDIVHTRSVIWHLVDPNTTLQRIEECLTPGGLFILADGEVCLHDENREVAPLAIEGEDNSCRSWFARWMVEWDIINAKKRGSSEWSLNEEVANLMGGRSTLGFEDVEYREYWAPIGWSGVGVVDGEEIERVMKANSIAASQAMKPAFLANGHEEWKVEKWLREVKNELKSPTVRLYMKWFVLTAFKKA